MWSSDFISRSINKKAAKKLDDNKKKVLDNLFSKTTLYAMVFFFFGIVLTVSNLKFQWIDNTKIPIGNYYIIYVLFTIVFGYIIFRKLKDYDFQIVI